MLKRLSPILKKFSILPVIAVAGLSMISLQACFFGPREPYYGNSGYSYGYGAPVYSAHPYAWNNGHRWDYGHDRGWGHDHYRGHEGHEHHEHDRS